MLFWKKNVVLRITLITLLALTVAAIYTIYQFQNKPQVGIIDFSLSPGSESTLSNVTLDIRYNASGPDEVFFGFDVRRFDNTTSPASIYDLETEAILIPQIDSSCGSCRGGIANVGDSNKDFIYVLDDSSKIRRHFKGNIFGKRGTHFGRAFFLHYKPSYNVQLDLESTKITLSNIGSLAIDLLYPTPDFCDMNTVTFESKKKIHEILTDGIFISGASTPETNSNPYVYLFPGLLLGVLLVVVIKLFV